MRIGLFLASSSELEEDRKEVEIWINRENKRLTKRGVFLELNLWEDFFDAMSQSGLQAEYNKVVEQSDIFVSLFATKVGKYTEEEFSVAHESFKNAGKPKYVYTYFKNVQVSLSDVDEEDFLSLLRFKRRLKELGHYQTAYNSTEDLTRHRGNQPA